MSKMHESDEQMIMTHPKHGKIMIYLLRGELEFAEYTDTKHRKKHICGPTAMFELRRITGMPPKSAEEKS